MSNRAWRAVVEVGFIIFLFYSNLLMGEFERSGMGKKLGLAWAVGDILTRSNLLIAAMAAFIGYVVFEFLRTSFRTHLPAEEFRRTDTRPRSAEPMPPENQLQPQPTLTRESGT